MTQEQWNKKRFRNWCFTINNYNQPDREDDREMLRELVPADCDYIIWGHEVGENGTPHLQGVVCFKDGKTLTPVKKLGFARAHLEPTWGPLARAIRYCMKDSDFEEHGPRPSQGFRTDLARFKRKIDEGTAPVVIAEEEEHFGTYVRYHAGMDKYYHHVRAKKMRVDREKPKVYLRIGDAGSGKTKWLDEQYGLAGWARMPNPTSSWWITPTVSAANTVLIDDVGPSKIPKIEEFLEWTDRYPIEFNSKGGFLWWKPKNIYFTSNIPWTEWWPHLTNAHREAVGRRIYRIDLVYKDQVTESFYPNEEDAQEEL